MEKVRVAAFSVWIDQGRVALIAHLPDGEQIKMVFDPRDAPYLSACMDMAWNEFTNRPSLLVRDL